MQTKTRRATYGAIVTDRAFEQGIRDFLEGKPFPRDYDALAGIFALGKVSRDPQTRYERGRLFAAALQGEGRKIPQPRIDRRINPERISFYRYLSRQTPRSMI